jgi:LacI family transcriptional regulator
VKKLSVTIKDIASAAGVSRGTVDRVLNNRGGVSPELERRIRQLVIDLNYKPNRAGKALAALKKPMKIGCFLPGVGNPFFDSIIRGFRQAEQELADFGVSLEISLVKGYDSETHIREMNSLAQKNLSALCVATVDVPEVRQAVNEIIASGMPVAAVNSDLSGTGRLFYVGCNYPETGRTAAGIFSMVQHKPMRLLVITGSLKMQGHIQRIDALTDELKTLGSDFSIAQIIEAGDDAEVAYRKTAEVLSTGSDINGVYVTSGGTEGVCRAICEAGLSGKIPVVCFDDIPTTRRFLRSGVITATICQEPFQQGYRSVKMLSDYLMSGTAPKSELNFTDTVIKIRENL